MTETKIGQKHLEKSAYVYLRQSTMGQVRHHRESTERQYALQNRAQMLGWRTENIKVLDGDLGLSGASSHLRQDFKTLVADVSMGKVGAVFALEASRLSRSNTDWHRLLELCSLTETLIIDEDGCYDPSDFNDQLLLGLKGTMSQAELHFIRARLIGGKINKAKKGELRSPLPVGLVYDEAGRTVLDPDEQVRGALQLLFSTFRECGSAYGVVQHFAKKGVRFPKRSYGGAWNGKLLWSNLSHSRVLGVLKNPSYAGVYVYGRYGYKKCISAEGQISAKPVSKPMSEWSIKIHEHHEGYITWEDFTDNQRRLSSNQTNGFESLLPGPAREGLAILQGLLICAECGHRVSIRYKGNGGIYPSYDCAGRRREARATRDCMSISAGLIDEAISKRIVEIIQPSEIKIAISAFEELERRTGTVQRQWQLKLERARYESELAQRRYEEVDPSNRLVALSLERNWNSALVKFDETQKQFSDYQQGDEFLELSSRKEEVVALGASFPKLWSSSTTQAKDRKRILRLLIKDITVKRINLERKVQLQIRWQGGSVETIFVDIPMKAHEKWKPSPEVIEEIRLLGRNMNNIEIAARFNKEGRKTNKGNSYTASIISWFRYKYGIPSPELKRKGELSVKEVASRFNVSSHVVYYWIERGVIPSTRRSHVGSPLWISLDSTTEERLRQWSNESTRISKVNINQNQIEQGAI